MQVWKTCWPVGGDLACAVMLATCFAPTVIGCCAAYAARCAQVNTFAQTAAVRSSGRGMGTARLGKLVWNGEAGMLDKSRRLKKSLVRLLNWSTRRLDGLGEKAP